MGNLNADLADLGGKLNTATNDLDDLNGAVVEVEGNVAELNGAVINVDGTVSDLKEKLDGTVVNVTDLKEDITDLSSNLEDQDDKVAKLNSTVINVNGTVSDLKEKLDGTVANVTDLKEDITDLSSNLEDQDGEIEKLKLLIEDLMELSNIFGGYEYAFSETYTNWDTHEARAISWGGHLASVHSKAEKDFIVKRMFGQPFLGGQRISNTPTDGSETGWKWSDGTIWDYYEWLPGQPSHAIERVNHQHATGWNDAPSSHKTGGVYKRPYP